MVMKMKLRGNVRNIRWAVQIASLVFFILIATAGLCVVTMGSFRVDCVFGALQGVFAQPVWVLILPLLIFVALPVIGTLILGRAFCGWLCPVGTVLDSFSRIPRVNFIKILGNPLNKYVVATAFLIGSFFLKYPSFCTVCPIKGVCYSAGLSGVIKPAELALLAVPVGIELGEKRGWCRYLCPVGATFAFLSLKKFLGFKVDTEKCLAGSHAQVCRFCAKACPTNAITESSYKTGEISRTECIACGQCYDKCPTGALKFDKLPLTARAKPN